MYLDSRYSFLFLNFCREKKLKCLHLSSNAVNISVDEEEEELLDNQEVPSFLSPTTETPWFYDNDNIVSAKYLHSILLVHTDGYHNLTLV